MSRRDYLKHLGFHYTKSPLMSKKNNTNPELPAEVEKQLTEKAEAIYEKLKEHAEGERDIAYAEGFTEGWYDGAASYAIKLHQAEQENTELRRWKIEAAELLTKIHSYAHKHLEIKLGESIVDFVIARAKERDEFKSENDKLKATATGWRPLLEEVLKHDAAFGELSIEIIDKIKKFLYGE